MEGDREFPYAKLYYEMDGFLERINNAQGYTNRVLAITEETMGKRGKQRAAHILFGNLPFLT